MIPIPPQVAARIGLAMTRSTVSIVWMVWAALFFAGSVGYVRYLSDFMSTFEIVLFRQVIGVALMAPWLIRSGRGALRTRRLSLHVLRAFLSYFGMLLSFYSFTLVTIADAMALQFTAPLFTTIFAILFLREMVGPHRWLAIVFGFVGVLMIVRPGFAEVNIGMPLALMAAAFFAGSNVSNRALSSTDSTAVIVFYGFVLQIPIAAVPAAMTWTTPGWDLAPALLLFGIVAATAQWCLARALANADASLVEPVMFLRLPFVAVIGYFIFAQLPDVWTWLGAAVIFASTYVLARREAAVRPAAPGEPG